MNSLLNQSQVVYSLDTSALFAAFNERYPIENFPPFWRKIKALITNHRLKMVEIAFEEAMRDTGVQQWCDQNQLEPYLQWTVDNSIQVAVSEILSIFPKLLDDRSGKSGADPWVVALAMTSRNCIVLTEEGPTKRSNRPKIPEACNHFGVEYISLVDLIRRENWVFDAEAGQ